MQVIDSIFLRAVSNGRRVHTHKNMYLCVTTTVKNQSAKLKTVPELFILRENCPENESDHMCLLDLSAV